MFAYIPARIGSTRIFKKNIRLLDKKAIICHVIENLLQVNNLQGIAVSTDSEEVVELVSKYSKVVTLALRECDIAGNQATFMDLVKYDLPRFQQYFANDDVLFTLATSALISADYFQQALTSYNKEKTGLVMSVKQLPNEALLALSQTEQGRVLPLFPQNYVLPTAELPKLFSDAGGFYAFNAKRASKKKMFIELQPISSVVLPNEIGIDVDDESDWQYLEKSYFKAKGLV